jgi:hypothetical protein
MPSIYLALNAAESEATREVTTKVLKELERARVSDAIRRRKDR